MHLNLRIIKFGDLESALYLFSLMANRDGIGDLLAEGVKAASKKVGQGSEKFAIHCKGLEWTGYECRNLPGMMLAYMTADVGAHHNRSWVCGYDVVGDSVGTVHDLIAGGSSADKRPKSAVIGKSAKVIELQHNRPMFDGYMKVKVYLSGHLKSLFPELPKEIVLEVEKPMSVDELACRLGITPWIVMSAVITGKLRSKDYLIEGENVEITLIGPMAGG